MTNEMLQKQLDLANAQMAVVDAQYNLQRSQVQKTIDDINLNIQRLEAANIAKAKQTIKPPVV